MENNDYGYGFVIRYNQDGKVFETLPFFDINGASDYKDKLNNLSPDYKAEVIVISLWSFMEVKSN